MAERKHITLIYRFDDNWIGGSYYILNIIRALNFLDISIRPKLTIVHDSQSPINDIVSINYPYIDYLEMNFDYNRLEMFVNKVVSLLMGFYLIKKTIPLKRIENLYPVSLLINTKNIVNYYYWIPDFQEYHLPQFFTSREIKSRKRAQLLVKKTNSPIVFSSYNALNDYNYIYKNNNNKKIVLQFVSILDCEFKTLSINDLLEKFAIKKRFFIVCNQFWTHKNHEIVLNAAKILKEINLDFQILFTGKEYDHRNPNYITKLKEFVKKNNLEETILFLGFIDRNEQLQLMNNSVSIIQPSLFEGWSTVVEDAKAMDHFILVSDIGVHKEQIENGALFFNPSDEKDLANKMQILLNNNINTNYNNDYTTLIKKYATEFIGMFN